MALIKISNHLLADIEIWELIYDFFDSVIIMDREYQSTILKVDGEGVPEGNTYIDIICYKFERIKTFILEVQVYAND